MSPVTTADSSRLPSLCLITTTYCPDLQRFALLRRSVHRFAAERYTHVAVVNTEDCAQFRRHFRSDTDLQIVPSADVLPWKVEQRRRKSGMWGKVGRLFNHRLVTGWHAQQLMKIFALAECPADAAVFLDSDVFLCKPLARDFFFSDGKLKLFRRPAVDAEGFDFDISTHEILGNPLHQVKDLFDYIYSPCSFRKSTALALLSEFERRRRNHWIRRFLAECRPSEYNLLGYAASVLEQFRGYHLVECEPEDLNHSIRFPEDRSKFASIVECMLNQTKQFALVQSTLGIEAGEVERAFDQLARALPLIGYNSAPAAHAAAPKGVRVRTKAAASAEAMAAAMAPSRNAR
jgi:Family of unknown function (DUF6492)